MLRKGGIGEGWGGRCRERQNSSWDPRITQAGLLFPVPVSPLGTTPGLQYPTFGGRLWQRRCQVWVRTAPLPTHPSPRRISWEVGVALLSPWQWQRGPGSCETAQCLHTCSSRWGKRGCSHLQPLRPQPRPPPPFAGMQFGWIQFGEGGIKKVEGKWSRARGGLSTKL